MKLFIFLVLALTVFAREFRVVPTENRLSDVLTRLIEKRLAAEEQVGKGGKGCGRLLGSRRLCCERGGRYHEGYWGGHEGYWGGGRCETHCTKKLFCFAHDSVVTTLDGEKTICALEVGDRVRSSSGWSTVLQMGKPDSKTELLDISFSNGKKIALTPTHYLKVNGTWVVSEEAQVGMYMNEDVKVTQIVKYYDHVCKLGQVFIKSLAKSGSLLYR